MEYLYDKVYQRLAPVQKDFDRMVARICDPSFLKLFEEAKPPKVKPKPLVDATFIAWADQHDLSGCSTQEICEQADEGPYTQRQRVAALLRGLGYESKITYLGAGSQGRRWQMISFT